MRTFTRDGENFPESSCQFDAVTLRSGVCGRTGSAVRTLSPGIATADQESGAALAPGALHVFEHRALRSTSEAIHLAQSAAADLIVVTTRSSVYELVVLRGEKGEVLVRGGNQFPEFCQARLVGSTAGGSALKLLTIDRGLRMEFHVGASMVVTTSPVRHLALSAADGDSRVCA